MPRFVILEHDHPTLHWDLMLEAGGVLKTWRLAAPPTGAAVAAAELGDHRAMYLDYEGPVSGGRGMVKRWDAGTYTELRESAPDRRCLRFDGERLQGSATLTRIDATHWRFEFFTAT
jgi:hypothetical protein